MASTSSEANETPRLTFPLREDLPQSYKAEIKQGYIRDRYDEYSRMISSFVDEGKTKIVVTGTPGIGTSIFIYFFEWCLVKWPGRRLVAAAFNESHVLIECKEWNSQDKKLITLDQLPTGNKGDLFLFDGSPPVTPAVATMICFTSPNEDFLREMIKFKSLYRLRFMPNWTLKEQRIAKDVLKLKINDKTLRERWRYFGGTVRFAFEDDVETIKYAVKDVKKALHKINSMREIESCFNGVRPGDTIVHSLLHYVLKDKNDINERLRPASMYIAYCMTKKVEKGMMTDRAKLINWLEGAGYSGTFLGWLFENVAHETLLARVDTEMKNLDTNVITSFKLPQSGKYSRFSLERPLEEVFLDAYRIPEAKNLRSIDSYHLTTDSLLLFQITRNVKHHVSTEGVIELVNSLGVLDKVLLNPNFLKLIFVVSKDLFHKFPKQKFHSKSVFSDMADVVNLSCSDVPGIGNKRKRTLACLGVATIGDLLQAKKSRPEDLSFVKSVVEDFEEHLKYVQHHDVISLTQQFVISLPYDPDEMVQKKNLDDFMMADINSFDLDEDL